MRTAMNRAEKPSTANNPTSCEKSKAKRLAKRKGEREANAIATADHRKATKAAPKDKKSALVLPHPPKAEAPETRVSVWFDRGILDLRAKTLTFWRGESKFTIGTDSMQHRGAISAWISATTGNLVGYAQVPVAYATHAMGKELRVPF